MVPRVARVVDDWLRFTSVEKVVDALKRLLPLKVLFETVAEIHGKHGRVVGQRELESQWNDWQSGCTLVIGDEVVSRQEMRHHKGVLKALITSKDVNIATKFMNLRSERNCMNIIFLSNETQPLVLDSELLDYYCLENERSWVHMKSQESQGR